MHICTNLRFFSIHVDGFFADYATAPANLLWKVCGRKKGGLVSVATLCLSFFAFDDLMRDCSGVPLLFGI